MPLPGGVRGQAALRPVYATVRVIRHFQLQRAEAVVVDADAGAVFPVCAHGVAPLETWEDRVGVGGP